MITMIKASATWWVPRWLLGGIALLTILLCLPGLPEHLIYLGVEIGIASLVALGLVVLTGVGGMTSFGQAVFVGLAAYTTAILSTNCGWSPWATLVPALAATGTGAFLVGAVTVRLSGHFLALGTVAWGMAIYKLFGSLPILGSHTGISGIPALSAGGYLLIEPRAYCVVVWLVLFACILLTLNLLDSRSGRALRALRSGGQTAEAFGVNVPRAKLWLFVYAALLAGLAGWLYAHFQRAISPELFSLSAGVEYLLMAVVGGPGHVFGAVLGAAIVETLREQLESHLPRLFGLVGSFETVVFGATLILMLMVERGGLWTLLESRLAFRKADVPIEPAKSAPPGCGRSLIGERDTLLLSVERLSKNFGGVKAVSGVSFELRSGEILGLIGPNGAGKSTVFNLLTGNLRMDAGTVRYRNAELTSLTPMKAAELGIARTFQHVRLVSGMSVLENVAIGGHLHGEQGPISAMFRLDRTEENFLLEQAAWQIHRVGLADVMHLPADNLPLGKMRLVEIARALSLNPVLLLLDEPAAGLRYMEKVQLGNLLRELSREGVTVLLVEHDMDFVMNLVNRLCVLDFGTVIAQGIPALVRKDPAVLAAYLGPPK